jgi:radical SAM enzyme (TIGR01210 family)
VIFNTKRCRYQCLFCQLPAKSSRTFISSDNILSQFGYVLDEAKHALSVLDRVTLSNEGSMLDADTFPADALVTILRSIHHLRRVQTVVIETRLEFATPSAISEIQKAVPARTINVLTGFETLNADIRDRTLGKRESVESFLGGLNQLASAGAELTAYVLYKPSPYMTDEDAVVECERSIDFLVEECARRKVGLTVRLNPMYVASGSYWAQLARSVDSYRPPRLSDVVALAAKKAQEGVRVYIGLSTEGLNEAAGYYTSREDYSPRLIARVKGFNEGRIASN